MLQYLSDHTNRRIPSANVHRETMTIFFIPDVYFN